MAFFDEIGKTLADKSREAAKKAKDLAEVLQLKAQINAEKGKNKELYAAIGTVYFKKHRNDENDEYRMFFSEIEKTLAHIAELEEKVQKLEKSETCPTCGAPVGKDDSFCAKCGAPVERKTEEETQAKEEPETEDEDALFEYEPEKLEVVEEEKPADPDDIFVEEDMAEPGQMVRRSEEKTE